MAIEAHPSPEVRQNHFGCHLPLAQGRLTKVLEKERLNPCPEVRRGIRAVRRHQTPNSVDRVTALPLENPWTAGRAVGEVAGLEDNLIRISLEQRFVLINHHHAQLTCVPIAVRVGKPAMVGIGQHLRDSD